MGLVSSCCCGCTLAQGTVGIGIVFVVRSIILFILGGILIDHKPEEDELDVSWYRKDEVEAAYVRGFQILGWGLVIDGAILLLATILLFVGVKTKRRNYILPWLIVVGAGFVISIPTIIYRLAMGTLDVTLLFVLIISYSIMIYLYIVVLSYYKSLQLTPHTSVAGQGVPTTVYSYDQPGYVIQPPPATGGYAAVPSDMKFQTTYPAYPPNLPPANYGQNPYPASQMPQYEAQYQPPPPYSDVGAAEHK